MRARGLSQAKRLFRAGKYREVLQLLEPQIFRYRTDAEFYTLVGLSCLHTGELGGAGTYLGRAHQLDDRSVPVLLGLAVVHLRRREPDDAVACWLKVLDIQPSELTARRGLDLLRTSPGIPDEKKTRSLLPRERRNVLRPLILVLGIAAGAVGLSYVVVRIIEAAGARPSRPDIMTVTLPTGRPEVVDLAADSPVMYTERELLRAFNRARRYLLDYRDNLAIHELNRILLSNATAAVKEKAALLKSFADVPDFRTIRDAFPYTQVAKTPAEYVDCHVRWSGRVANTVVTDQSITFDLLVGYQDGRVLEGVAPIRMGFAAIIEDGEAYEVLGRVLPAEAAGIPLEAVSIRPIEGSAP